MLKSLKNQIAVDGYSIQYHKDQCHKVAVKIQARLEELTSLIEEK